MLNAQGVNRNIPVNVENQVRAECGYGCAYCGAIFVELHHFDPPFVEATRHDPAGIIALCQLHHSAAANGEMSLTQVRNLRINPIALRQGYSSEYIITSADAPQLRMGGSMYIASNLKFCVDVIPIVWIAGHNAGRPLTINAIFRDENFEPILTIRNNTVLKKSDSVEIQKIGNRYLIGSRRDPILEFSVSAGNIFEISRFQAYGVDNRSDILPTHVQTGAGYSSHNVFGGFNAIFGQSPNPYSGQFVEEQPFEWILNAKAERIGKKQGERIFDLTQHVRAEIVDNNQVRRVFRKVDGTLVFEHPTASYKNGIIYLPFFDAFDDLPMLPIPSSLTQEVRCFQENGSYKSEWCISDFFCDSRMPEMMCGTGPFATVQ